MSLLFCGALMGHYRKTKHNKPQLFAPEFTLPIPLFFNEHGNKIAHSFILLPL